MTTGGFDACDHGRRMYFNSQPAELIFGASGKILWVSGQNSWAAFEQDNAGFLGIDGSEFVRQSKAGNF
jgi:hypothetical protein